MSLLIVWPTSSTRILEAVHKVSNLTIVTSFQYQNIHSATIPPSRAWGLFCFSNRFSVCLEELLLYMQKIVPARYVVPKFNIICTDDHTNTWSDGFKWDGDQNWKETWSLKKEAICSPVPFMKIKVGKRSQNSSSTAYAYTWNFNVKRNHEVERCSSFGSVNSFLLFINCIIFKQFFVILSTGLHASNNMLWNCK